MTQPVLTLERDEETIWPELAKQHAAQMVAVQPQGCAAKRGAHQSPDERLRLPSLLS